jgi:hypothetical protein
MESYPKDEQKVKETERAGSEVRGLLEWALLKGEGEPYGGNFKPLTCRKLQLVCWFCSESIDSINAESKIFKKN